MAQTVMAQTVIVAPTVEQMEARLAAAVTGAEKIAALNALAWEMRTTDLRRALG